MDRRKYLTSTVVVLTGTIAGCTGSSGDSGGSDGPTPVESGDVSRNLADNYVAVEQGDTIRVVATEEEQGGGGGTRVELYTPDGEQILEQSVEDTATVTHQAEGSGDYRVLVATGGDASYEIYVE